MSADAGGCVVEFLNFAGYPMGTATITCQPLMVCFPAQAGHTTDCLALRAAAGGFEWVYDGGSGQFY